MVLYYSEVREAVLDAVDKVTEDLELDARRFSEAVGSL